MIDQMDVLVRLNIKYIIYNRNATESLDSQERQHCLQSGHRRHFEENPRQRK